MGQAPQMEQESIADKTLRSLEPDPDLDNCLLGIISDKNQNVELRICPDKAPIAECLEVTRRLLLELPSFDHKARDIAGADLLENYNDSWRIRGEWKDGGCVDIELPHLTSEQFRETLILTDVMATGVSLVALYYSGNQTFGDHAVSVTSFDGLKFSDTYVELLGVDSG